MSGSVRLAAAAAVAAFVGLFALPAFAADLYVPPRAGYQYDDPRYADVYPGEPPRYERYEEPFDELDAPYPPRGVYEDEYQRPYYRYGARSEACVPRHVVRDRLRDQGWSDFYGFEPRGRVVLVQARRPSGRLFDLTIERCSGEIIEARPLNGRRFDAYAYQPRRRWSSYRAARPSW